MSEPKFWFMGLPPQNRMDRMQDETEAMYAEQDRREWEARFEEAPCPTTATDKPSPSASASRS